MCAVPPSQNQLFSSPPPAEGAATVARNDNEDGYAGRGYSKSGLSVDNTNDPMIAPSPNINTDQNMRIFKEAPPSYVPPFIGPDGNLHYEGVNPYTGGIVQPRRST